MHKATWKLGPYPWREEDPLWEKIAYDFLHGVWRRDYNTCGQCGSSNTAVHNFDRMWGDGDLMCEDCGHRVRTIDTG